MKVSIDYIHVKVPYLRLSFNHRKNSSAFLQLPKADHVKVGSVVITRSDVAILDIGLVKSVRDGKPTEIYARKSEWCGPEPNQYGGVSSGRWYDTGIRMPLDKWCQLGHDMKDASGFYDYWNNRLS